MAFLAPNAFGAFLLCYNIVMNLPRVSLGLIAFSLVLYLLYIAQSLIIPLVIAILAWYVIISLQQYYQQSTARFFQMPRVVALIFSFATFAIIAWIFVGFVNSNVQEVITAGPRYQIRFESLLTNYAGLFGYAGTVTVRDLFKTVNLTTVATTVASLVTTFAGFAGIILIYVIFLLLEYHTFPEKIQMLFPRAHKRKEFMRFLERISRDINTYIKIKTLVSLLTALASYIVLLAMGVEFAAFWAGLIFVLNYIPNVGSLVAVMLPVIFSLVQFDQLLPTAILAGILTSIQIFFGNILEPRLMGKSLNLSPLVIIISLVVWGYLWGPIGMFLCVPIMVVINIILSHFKSTRPIAILLSSRGQLE